MTSAERIDHLCASAAYPIWIMAAQPCAIHSRVDWRKRTAPVGTKARVTFHGASTWCETTDGQPIVIERRDLSNWEVCE